MRSKHILAHEVDLGMRYHGRGVCRTAIKVAIMKKIPFVPLRGVDNV